MSDVATGSAVAAVAGFAPPLPLRRWLRRVQPAARFILQGDAAALSAAASTLGLAADTAGASSVAADADPGMVRHSQSSALLWLGPDERLIIAWQESAASLGDRLERALVGQAHSLVDVTHRQLSLGLAGRSIEELLACGCPLDLDVAQFPPDRCARTLFGKTEIVLWRRGRDEFHIEVWRSYADYLERWLIEAAQDLPLEP